MSLTTQSPDSTVKLTLMSKDYRPPLFEENISFFKIKHPEIYNVVLNYASKDFVLCSNPDGSPNILDLKTNIPLYNTFTYGETLSAIKESVINIKRSAHIGNTFVLGGDENWRKDNTIQVTMLNELYAAGIFNKLQLKANFLTPLISHETDFLPFVRVCGIGLGYHLTELVKNYNISYITIYEPHLDLFYSSLYTIPWKLLFQYFTAKGKGINLSLGLTPEAAIESNTLFIQQRLTPLNTCYYRLNHFSSNKIKEINSQEPLSDVITRDVSDAGWYEDQRAGFYWGARNIRQKNKVYTGKKVKKYFRAFIVGSGPSLNKSIHYIKQHQRDALIISCGSAISALLRNDIVPDYQVVQERFWHYGRYEEDLDQEILKNITLIKLNVCSPKSDKYYKETLVIQKFRDPGSSLLGEEYTVTKAVNPSVTNAGVSILSRLGVNEIYLFGADYGAPKDSKKMHASGTIYDDDAIDDTVESRADYNLPGNFGAEISSDAFLSWSLKTTELTIAEYPNIKWINVGEGALIKGAIPTRTDDLPKRFSKPVSKKNIKYEISKCFNNHYSSSETIEHLKTIQMQQVNEYFDALLGFMESTPQTREEVVYVLGMLYSAVSVGQNESHFLPASLLSFGFKQFITDVYIQNSLEIDDESAAIFFQNTKKIFTNYIIAIHTDLNQIIQAIDAKEEIDLLHYNDLVTNP